VTGEWKRGEEQEATNEGEGERATWGLTTLVLVQFQNTRNASRRISFSQTQVGVTQHPFLSRPYISRDILSERAHVQSLHVPTVRTTAPGLQAANHVREYCTVLVAGKPAVFWTVL
jgi:hypothetical protein